jgi:mRNA-capping enzyme
MGYGSGPGPIPPRWLKCPRKSDGLVANRFLACKTPLDEKYDDQVPPECRFTPVMLFNSMKQHKVKIGLWIDLTNTKRFYDKQRIEDQECAYVKISCRGHGETPSVEATKTFIDICNKFVAQHPTEIIAVHCTHGFNRTGFLVCAFLVEAFDWSVDMAVNSFITARKPGIYKEAYLKELFRRYAGDPDDAPPAPELPEWCYEEDTGVDEDGEPIAKPKQRQPKRGGKFMDGVPGVELFITQPRLGTIQKKVQNMCEWKKGGFPGCQPVSMDKKNLSFIQDKPYKVSWKADGTRYMMLLDGQDEVYFIDRDNCVYKVSGLTFLHRKDQRKHIHETLLDGEMVIDIVDGQKFPRFLVYDIIRFDGNEVGKVDFGTRLICIDKEIVGARNTYIIKGLIDKTKEPFSIRKKEFWDVSDTYKLMEDKFTKNLAHEPDGLIFQPAREPYHPGQDDTVLKWKPASMNSVDFKLKIVTEEGRGLLPKRIGQLFVGGLDAPFSQIKINKDIKELNNKIIECKWDNNQWTFMRERTDKSFPNGYRTAVSVIESIKDPVTEQILLDFIQQQRWRKPDIESMPPPHKIQRR